TSVVLIPEKGLSVISDFDDTVKESDVHIGRRAAARTLLFGEAAAVPGMADLYRLLQSKGAAFHYVSASPHQLLPSVAGFLTRHRFPLGHLALRNVWAAANLSSRAYKRTELDAILRRLPARAYVLVGDAGEKDAETFATFYEAYPNHVLKIFIRDVTVLGPGGVRRDATVAGPDDRGKKQAAFVRTALAKVPPNKWAMFASAEELLLDEDVAAYLRQLDQTSRAAI
ncbi:hypothetical protein HK405_002699, partial [Cladochytrium tenue]